MLASRRLGRQSDGVSAPRTRFDSTSSIDFGMLIARIEMSHVGRSTNKKIKTCERSGTCPSYKLAALCSSLCVLVVGALFQLWCLIQLWHDMRVVHEHSYCLDVCGHALAMRRFNPIALHVVGVSVDGLSYDRGWLSDYGVRGGAGGCWQVVGVMRGIGARAEWARGGWLRTRAGGRGLGTHKFVEQMITLI